jgi:hypothetical protein
MTPPKGAQAVSSDAFQFSQSNLQDFVDCQRRFQLRYLLRLAWPAVESEPIMENERHMQRGSSTTICNICSAFRQSASAPAARRNPAAVGTLPDLPPSDLKPGVKVAPGRGRTSILDQPVGSVQLAASGCRLIAKYDLIALTPSGQALIFDWKTSANAPSASGWLNACNAPLPLFVGPGRAAPEWWAAHSSIPS